MGKIKMNALIILTVTILAPAVVVGQSVFVFPGDKFVSIPGGDANFLCISQTTTKNPPLDVEWLVNGSSYDTLDLHNTSSDFGNNLGSLTFSDLLVEYNNTRIQCRVTFRSGSTLFSNGVTLLLIQGLLTAVTSLSLTVLDGNIHLTWVAPPTLDITGVNPDIEGYCVDVVNSTSIQTIYTECNITETEFSYLIPPDSHCNIYLLTVTPVNRVGNGTMATKGYSGTEIPLLVDTSLSADSTSMTLIMSAPVCSAELMIKDLDTGECKTVGNTDLNITGNSITFTHEQVRTNRHYNVTVTASILAGSASSNTTISTHDVTSISITERRVATTYSEQTSARGALYSFVSSDGENLKLTLLVLDRNSSLNFILPFGLSAGQYRVFVYDIEQDGTLPSGVGYPAVSDQLSTLEINEGSDSQSTFSYIEDCTCDVNTTSSQIRVQCTYPSNTLATGFQMIAQPISQVHKLYVNQTTDLQSAATVVVEDNSTYQVTIFPIRGGMGVLGSSVEYTQEVTVSSLHPMGLPTEEPEGNNSNGIIIGVAIVVGCVMIFSIVLVLICTAKYLKSKPSKGSYITTPNDEPPTVIADGTTIVNPESSSLVAHAVPVVLGEQDNTTVTGDDSDDETEEQNTPEGPHVPFLTSNSPASNVMEGEGQVKAEIDADTQSIKSQHVYAQESGLNEETPKNTANREISNQVEELHGLSTYVATSTHYSDASPIIAAQELQSGPNTEENAPEDPTDDTVAITEKLDKILYVAITGSKQLPYVSSSDDGTAHETEATSSNKIVTNVKPDEETNETGPGKAGRAHNMPLLSATRDNDKIDGGPVVRPAPSPEPDHALPRFQQLASVETSADILSNQDQAPEHVADSSGQESSVELPLPPAPSQEPELPPQSLASPSAEGTPPALEPESGVQQEGEQSATSSSSQNNPQFGEESEASSTCTEQVINHHSKRT